MLQVLREGNFAESVAVVPPTATEYDASVNDPDKSFTVPGNELWKMNWAHARLTSSATVGNRQFAMDIYDDSNNLVFCTSAGATQAASMARDYLYMQGTFRETAFVANELQGPLPSDLYLGPGYRIRFYDASAIDSAADDMTIAFQYSKFVI